MKIFFTAAYRAKQDYQKTFNHIVDTLQELKAEVISLEVQKYQDILDEEIIENLSDDEIHYLYLQKGIDRATAVVIEASTHGFQLGHEATLALNLNKPVLVLSDNKDYSNNIKHHKFYAHVYKSNEEIKDLLQNFIKEVKSKHTMQRFNTMISPQQRNYLEWKSRMKNTNASEIVRKLINEDMQNNPSFEKDTTRFGI